MWPSGNKDEALVRRTLRGEAAAFETLVQRYLPAVRAQAFARVHTLADAEDVAQDTFLHAYAKLDTLREPRKFGAWLLSIARHCASRICERRMRDANYAEHVETVEIVNPQIEKRELLQLLRIEIDKLDDDTRETVLLHYFAGRTSREIAAAMGATPAAVRKRLQRARVLLSERLLRDAAHEHDDRPAGKRIMGIIATLPAAWKTSSTTIAAGTLEGGISGVTVMKVIAVAATLALIGVGVTAFVNNQDVSIAANSSSINTPAEHNKNVPDYSEPDAGLPPVPVPVADTPENSSIPTTWDCPVRGLVSNFSGDPVEGATVIVYLKAFGPDSEILASAHGETDASGTFVVTVPREYGGISAAEIRVKKGNEFGYLPISLGQGYKDSQWLVSIFETMTVRGKVIDSGGRLIAAATVTFYECQPDVSSAGPSSGYYPRTTTFDDGSFSLENIWRGTCGVAAEAPGFKPTVLPDVLMSASDLIITMEEAPETSTVASAAAILGAIQGHVLDATTGAGIAGVTVQANGTENGVRSTAISDDDGAFEVARLSPGTYALEYIQAPSVPPPTYDPAQGAHVEISAKKPIVSDIALRVDRRFFIEGTVAKADGTPVAGPLSP